MISTPVSDREARPAQARLPDGARAHEHQRRRMLIVGAVPPPYFGGSVVTQTLLESSLAQRYELLHVDTSDRRGADNIGRLDAANVWLAGIHATRFLKSLVRSRADIIYLPVAQNTLGFLRDALFLVPAALSGIPIVVHFHGGRFDEFLARAPAAVRVLARLLLGRVARAIVLGSVLRDMLGGIVAAERIAVVPNGVPDPGPMVRQPRDGPLRVLFLGNLIPEKGYGELVRAAGRLREAGAEVELVLAGAVTDAAAHERVLADSRPLGGRVRFVGPVDAAAKRRLLREVDVLALPSYYGNEAHPLVLLEAMAAGLPVVATRHVAIPEIVEDGETGILVEPRDVDGLTTALRRFAVDPALRVRLGAAGRRRYEAEFTAARWATRMARVFDSVAGAEP
ncbi:MAG TPA: glycosyltransferase family 4 protein [Longimicrobiales bacterium]